MHKPVLKTIALAAFFMLAGCAAQADNSQSFTSWLEELKREAVAKGVSSQTVDEAFATSVAPIPRIIELDRKQPESKMTLEKYMASAVSDRRIEEGTTQLADYDALLSDVSRKYGVQKEFIVALWGIETNYGENTGGFDVFDALATLAYDGRRSEYFRGELINALKIVDADHISVESMHGSWAGAMGQCQFMPTSFLEYAVDYNGDGKRDIWDTQEDVFASIANYLSSSGWDGSLGWGFEVSLPPAFNAELLDIKSTKTREQWEALGVRDVRGGSLLSQSLLPSGAELSVIKVGDGETARHYIISNNYKVLLKWNRSRFFATAVSTLADSIK